MSEPQTDNFDLLRKLIETDFPDRLALFDECAHRFRSLHPDDDIFQFLVATGFLSLVLRAVPERVAEVLARHDAKTQSAAEKLSQVANQKLAQIRQASQFAAKMDEQAQRLETVSSDVVARLVAATAAHENAIYRIKAARQQNDLLFWISMLLLDALLGFLAGMFYMQHRS